MSLEDRLAAWAKDDNWDETPTSEDALRMFLFSGIADFIEENEDALLDWLANSKDPEVVGLNDWVDAYANRPVTEPDGYARLAASE